MKRKLKKRKKLFITDREGIKILHEKLATELDITIPVQIEFLEGDTYRGDFQVFLNAYDKDDETHVCLEGKIILTGIGDVYSIPHYLHEFTHLYRYLSGGNEMYDNQHSSEFYESLKEVIEIVKSFWSEFEYPADIEYPEGRKYLKKKKLDFLPK